MNLSISVIKPHKTVLDLDLEQNLKVGKFQIIWGDITSNYPPASYHGLHKMECET